MFRIQEFPDEVFPGRGKEAPAPPESQRGHTPGSKQPDTPIAEVRNRIGSDTPSLEPEVQDEPGGAFRARSRSAPPILWAAMRYGRELRRMSDEFDVALQVSNRRPVVGMEKGTIRCWGGFGEAKKTSSLTSEEPLQHPLEVLPRPKSAGTTSQLQQGNSWKETLQAWLGHRPARDAHPRSSK